MLNELAVIASDTGANSEIIDDGNTGILYNFNDAGDLFDKICNLLSDKSKIEIIGKNGRKRALNFFSANSNASNIFSLLLSIKE